LIGYPGVGKYTIAQAIARLAEGDGRRFVVSTTITPRNVIFSVMDVDGLRTDPRETWTRVGEVREALYRAIATLSPTDWSFIFTNVLTEGEPLDAAAVERVCALAAERGNPYVPVHLICASEEVLRRVTSPSRRERLKWVDVDGVRAFIDEPSCCAWRNTRRWSST